MKIKIYFIIYYAGFNVFLGTFKKSQFFNQKMTEQEPYFFLVATRLLGKGEMRKIKIFFLILRGLMWITPRQTIAKHWTTSINDFYP